MPVNISSLAMFQTSALALKLLHTAAYVSAYMHRKGLAYLPNRLAFFSACQPPKRHQLAFQAISFPYTMHSQDKTTYKERQTYKTERTEFSVTTENMALIFNCLTHFQTNHFNVTKSDTEHPVHPA